MPPNNGPFTVLTDLYPRNQGKGGWQRLRAAGQELYDYRFFVRRLIEISLTTDYKRSFIGLTWLVILPLVSVVIWILLNGAGVISPGKTAIPYPAYVLLSTSIWGFFAEFYRSTSRVFITYGRMMSMVDFPRGTVLLEVLAVHLIRFAIPFSLNVIVLLLFGVRFTWWALLFPLTLVPLLLAGAAVGLLVALLRIVAVDISNLADEGIRLLMFLTPVIYAPRINLGALSFIIELNPMTYLISFSRDLLTKGTFYEPTYYLLTLGGTLLLFVGSARLYRRAQPRIIERLINN